MDDDALLSVFVTDLAPDEGVLMIFAGIHESHGVVHFAVDPSYAPDIVEELSRGEHPTVQVPSWALVD